MWKHQFKPEFSWTALLTLVGLAVLAFVIGWLSVTLVPYVRARKSQRYYKGAKAPNKAKVKIYRDASQGLIESGKYARSSASVMMTSTEFSAVISVIAGIAMTIVFAKEHGAGIMQFCMNHMIQNEDTGACAAIITIVAIIVVFLVCAPLFLFLMLKGEELRVKMIVAALKQDGYIPIFCQRRAATYIVYMFFYALWHNISKRQ